MLLEKKVFYKAYLGKCYSLQESDGNRQPNARIRKKLFPKLSLSKGF